MSDEEKETIIEFESVKKGRKAIFFVLIGLFVASTVAFMLLWILKPAGSSVGVQDILITSDIKKSGVDDNGNDIYIASVGGKYTVSADVSVIGEVDAKTAVEWSVFPSDCVSGQTTGVDPENPNRSTMSFTVSPNAITNDGSDTDITVRATSPFGKGVVAEFNFKARASYAAEGKIESVMFGDRGFTITRKDSEHYSVEIPYFSTSRDPDMYIFRVNLAQFAEKAENGDYMELTRDIPGKDGKQIDDIKYEIKEGADIAKIPSPMNGESVLIQLTKTGTATLVATLNAYNNGVPVYIYLDITAKDITEYDVLSSIRFKRNEYTLFLNRQGDMLNLQDEIIFSKDPPEGGNWTYDVYESDISGNATTSNRKLIVNRSVSGDGKTVITISPVSGGTVGDTYITVRDNSKDGYGVFHTASVKVRNYIYSETGDALSVTRGGETEFADYQGETVDLSVTYKLAAYDGKLTADNLTTELYFYYNDPTTDPFNEKTGSYGEAKDFVTFSGITQMTHKGALEAGGKKTQIHSLSPISVKISEDGKTATAVIKAKIGGTAPAGRVGITFVTYPQSSHKDPDVLDNAILDDSSGVYISSNFLNIDVIKTVTSISVKTELGDLLSDGSRFFHWTDDKANEYRLVRPAGVTSVSPYSILDLFDYKGSSDTKVEFGTNVPKNLDISVPTNAQSVLETGYEIAGSASETNDPAVITVTLNKGKKGEIEFKIKVYYKVTIKEAALPDSRQMHSAYQLDASAYKNGDIYGFVSTQHGGIGNSPSVVQFYDQSVHFTDPDDKYISNNPNNVNNKWKKNWNIERYIFIGKEMLVKVPANDVIEGNKTLVAYFYLSDQVKNGVTPDAKEALYKMDVDGYIYVNRDLFAYMMNNSDVKCDSINVVYSAYKIKSVGGGFELDGGEFYGTETYDDYDSFVKCGLMALRNYVAHRGFDGVDFYNKDYSASLNGTADVNVGSTFTLYPSGIISYYKKSENKVVDLVVGKAGLSDSFHIGSFKVTNNDTSGIETVDEKTYQYKVKTNPNEPIENAFTLSAVYTNDRTDASKNKTLDLNVKDQYLPIDTIAMYMSQSDATNQRNPVQNDTVMQLVRGSAEQTKIKVWFRIGYVPNTNMSYTYLSGLLFKLIGQGDDGGVSGSYTFGSVRATINENPYDEYLVPADKAYHIVSVDFELVSDISDNEQFDIEITPWINKDDIPNVTARVAFKLDVTTYAEGVTLSSPDTDENFAFAEKNDGSGDYTADINLTQSEGAIVTHGDITLNVSPFVSSGTADSRHVKISVNSDGSNDAYFIATASGTAVKLTPTSKATCLNSSNRSFTFTVTLTEERYVLRGTSWIKEEESKTLTVFVNITADIYKVEFGSPSGEIAIKVSGATGSTARAEFSVTYNDANIRDTKDELVYALSDDKDEKIRIEGNTIVVDNDITFSGTVTLTASSKKDGKIKAEKTIRISSLDTTLSFANFANGGGNGYTADYKSDGTVDIIYFGANSMDFTLNVSAGDDYDVSYSITEGTANVSNGVVTWNGDGANRFTLRAVVGIKSSGGNTREKTIVANVTANARATRIDGLNNIAGYDEINDEIVAYEGTEIDFNGKLAVKASDGEFAAEHRYTVEVDESDAANAKISAVNNVLTVSSLDAADDGKYEQIRITAVRHTKDTAERYSITVRVKLIKLTEQDKTLVMKKGGAVVSDDAINVATLKTGNEFTAEFATGTTIEKLVSVYGAKVEYSLTEVNDAATIDGNTITVNALKNGSFTVKATVKFGDRKLFESSFTKRVENDSAMTVKYGTSNALSEALSSGDLDIGYNGLSGDTEKHVYAFVGYSDLGIDLSGVADADISKYFTPYASGQSVALLSVTHNKADKVFVAEYRVSPIAYNADGLKPNFGKLYLGGTIRFGGYDYSATNAEFDLTATAPTVTLLSGNNAGPLEPTIKGGTENARPFNTEISGYTLGDNYTIDYELLSDGNLVGGNYDASDNILKLSANGKTATFTAKSYVNGSGAIVPFTKNSIKLRVKVAITKGIYAGYTAEKIITVSVNEKTAPTFALKTDIDKYNAEFGGIVLDKITDNDEASFAVLTGTGVAGQFKLSDNFTASVETYTASASGLENSTDYSSSVAGKQRITVNITVNDGYFKDAKIPLAFDIFVLPSVKVENSNIDIPRDVTAGKTVTVSATADAVDGASPVISFVLNGTAGYISSVTVSGNTATATFVPNVNEYGDVNITAQATYKSGSYGGRTVSAKTKAVITVLSAKLADVAADANGNKIENKKVYISPRTSFTLPDAVALGKTASGSAVTTFDLIDGAYEAGKITRNGKTLSASVDANTASSGNVTYTNALEITVKDGSTTYVGYADIIVLPKPLDEKPTGITVTGTGTDNIHPYTLSVDGVKTSVRYTAKIIEGESAIENVPSDKMLTVGNDGVLTFNTKVVKVDTPIVILVTATVQTDCFGELTFTKYVYETVRAQIDPLPVLGIEYNGTTFTVKAYRTQDDKDNKTTNTVSISNISLDGTADGFKILSGTDGVFGYELIANENASVTLTAYATLTSGDHTGKIITVTETFSGDDAVVPTQARVMPTFTASGSMSGLNGSYSLSVTNATNPTYGYEILAGKSILTGTDKVVIDKDANTLTFTATAQKQDTPIKIRVSATVTVPYYGTVTLYDDIDATVTKTDAPTLTVTNSENTTAKVNTLTVTVSTTESNVTIENIDLIIENASGLTVTKTATGATYTFVSDDASKSVAYSAKATVKGGVYNGDTITRTDNVTITRTEVPDVEPTLKVAVNGNATDGYTIDVTAYVGTDTAENRIDINSVTLVVSFDGFTLNRVSDGHYTYTLVSENATENVPYTVFATVNKEGNDFNGRILSATGELKNLARTDEPVVPDVPDPVPVLDVSYEQVDKTDESAPKIIITVSTTGDTKVALRDFTIVGISGGTGSYDEATKTYTYVCEYDPAAGFDAATVTVFATVSEGDHTGRVIKGSVYIEKIDAVTVTPPVTPPDTGEGGGSETPEITE